jgi:hypothetical protein
MNCGQITNDGGFVAASFVCFLQPWSLKSMEIRKCWQWTTLFAGFQEDLRPARTCSKKPRQTFESKRTQVQCAFNSHWMRSSETWDILAQLRGCSSKNTHGLSS